MANGTQQDSSSTFSAGARGRPAWAVARALLLHVLEVIVEKLGSISGLLGQNLLSLAASLKSCPGSNPPELAPPPSTLPEDTIIMEILPYLPAKSVGRFRSVSRAWHAALSSATFVELHLRRANRQGGHPRLFFCPSDAPTGEEEEAYFHVWQPGGPVKKLTRKPKEFWDPAPITRPVHGLHLVESKGYHVYNPSTGSSLLLPDSIAPLKMSRRYETSTQPQPPYFLDVSYGLGYCSVTAEYKAVRLFSDSYNDGPPCCEVYILGRAAYWRPAAQQPPMCIVSEGNPGVFISGYLHFISVGNGIITFNVSDETFALLLPPPPSPNSEDTGADMLELNGRLCVCHGGSFIYRIWMLLGDGEPRQWEQLLCLDLRVWTEPELMQIKANWTSPLYMFNSDDDEHRKIMFGTGSCMVFAVDANGGTLDSLFRVDDAMVTGGLVDSDHESLGLFQESLVPVGRTVEEIVFSSPAKQAWFHILKWMPARSVADLSLVCREWRAMIMTERFKRSHVLHANLNKSPRIMMIFSPDERCIDLENYIDLDDAPDDPVPGLACSQPCHGLNVGSSHTGSFVCNPITAYCHHIAFEDDEDTSFSGRIGLGYNSETSKHVLVLTSYNAKDSTTLEYQLECKLRYVEERDWRPIDPPPRPILASTPPTYANGKICWLVEPNLGQASSNCEIVAFDVKSEEFEVLQGPQCSHPVGRMSILCLQGALCVACSNLSVNVIDIWMRKGNNGTWLREYHIDLTEFGTEYSSEETTPLAIDTTDRRILLSTGRSLGYYDPKTAALETIYSLGMEEYDRKFSPIICEESLVFTLGLA